ncbi:hypothetical protein [Streptomyces triticiradicis]|uniref:Uncharacterized protein n=1 Tax=Streptomyces triticiradicis TaxID=2651189 RepID=A0A7J5DDB1_9ACTN|nr:hypothetical protein [Streptomyces triticiradicis]KAB1985841.1 hypothetical protein F8144_25115 [Streptomyces triticiradicis]
MPTSQSDASTPSDDRATPDKMLHTGAEGPVTAEDLVLATGRDVTPKNLAWAERKLQEEGSAAVNKLLP